MNNLTKLLLQLSLKKEFEFLNSTLELNNQLKNTVLNSNVKQISVIDKTPYENFFFNEKEPDKLYVIDDNLSYEIYKLLVFEKGCFLNGTPLKKRITFSINQIINSKKLENCNLNKEILVFKNLIGENKNNLINKLFIMLLQTFTKQVIKNRVNFNETRFKYTDMCFKLGGILFKVFIDNIKSKTLINLFISKNNHIEKKNEIYIDLIKNNKNLQIFLKNTKNQKNNLIITELINLFNTTENITSNYLYKLFRTYVLYNLYEKNDKYPVGFSEIHLNYTRFRIKFGCLILEKFIENNIFTKDYIFKANSSIKTPLIIKCYPELVDVSMLNMAIQRPYLTKNTIKTILEKTKTVKFNISEIENELLYHLSLYRENNYIGQNSNMTTEINNEVYLNEKNNLTTKFVIDKDYLYSFLKLLKYHMLERKKDISLNFENQLKKHENIFLLYQLSIESIIEFYNKYKMFKEIKLIFKNILKYILNYNIEDVIVNYYYNVMLSRLKKKKIIKILEMKKIETFINDLFNKIFSYKLFIKGLLKECILYSNFRYFILDSFIDTRGRCYYNGFYLNPQSYPITKAFIKLYDPTPISNKSYTQVIFPTIKKSLNFISYKNILDNTLNTYDKYIQQQEILKQEYLNSMLKAPVNIEKDIVEKFKNIHNSTELALKLLNYIKPKIKKVKKLYVVYSMFIRILYPRTEIKNYFELDATASGLQMTAMLFQDKKLAYICNLVKNPIEEDIYHQCSSFLLNDIELFNTFETMYLNKIPNSMLIKINLLTCFNSFLNKELITKDLITQAEQILPDPLIIFENENHFERFLNTFSWFTFDCIKLLTKYKKELNIKEYQKILFYLIICRGLKLTELEKQLPWLSTWIKSRDFSKKAIMTYGYNATEYRRKEEWMIILLKLNNYEKRVDLFFIATICENLFCFITHARLKACNNLKKLGILCKNELEKNILENELTDNTSTSINIKNKYLNMKIHCYKQVTKRIDIKGLSNKRKYQLTIKHPVYMKKVYKNKDHDIFVKEIKLQDYNLISRKFTPNFIHSMDAFIVHIFKEKMKQIFNVLSEEKIIINHMTNHDNFTFTLEPFLKIILMDCYNILYTYDYIHTLNTLNFYPLIVDFKLFYQKKNNIEDLLPGKFNLIESKNIFVPSIIDFDSNFMK